MKRIAIAGAIALTLGFSTISPVGNFILPKTVSAAATLATPLPKELKLDYIVKEDQSGTMGGQYKIDLGSRTGTLVLKMYMTDKYWKSAADTLYTDTKNKRVGGFGLFNSETAFTGYDKQLVAFDRYAKIYDNNPNYVFKYTTGFANAGVNKQEKRFITLGVYLDKEVNNGVYYLDTPNMGEGLWDVKAYFYDGVNVEKRVFQETDRYFPLVDKIRWGVAELKQNQIGRLTMLKDTPLLKQENEKMVVARKLNKDEQYRIYGYKEIAGKGYYAVGDGHYVEMNPTLAKYETPTKEKLRLVKIMHEE